VASGVVGGENVWALKRALCAGKSRADAKEKWKPIKFAVEGGELQTDQPLSK